MCEVGYDRLLEKLLDRGADPNARDRAKNNKPAIVLAAEGNHVECIKLLMVSNVDKNAVYDVTGIGAIHRYSVWLCVMNSHAQYFMEIVENTCSTTAYLGLQRTLCIIIVHTQKCTKINTLNNVVGILNKHPNGTLSNVINFALL